MSVLDNLLTKWRLWINRDSTFKKDELKELQSHLMEEISYLVNREGLSEEEAFHKAVSLVGEREGLDQEYVKDKSKLKKILSWIRKNPKKVVTIFSIVIFLCGYMFAWFPLSEEANNLKKQIGYIQTFKGSFRAFQAKKITIPKINNPRIAWKFEWDNVLERPDFINSLTTDEDGNVYFVAESMLYSLNSIGKIRWVKNNIDSDFIYPCRDGILVKEWSKSNFFSQHSSSYDLLKIVNYDKEGNKKWDIIGNNQIIGPDGMVYAQKPNKDNQFFSCDADGKIRWIFTLPKKMKIHSYFFDTKNNVYLLTTNTYYHILHMFRFSSFGKLLDEQDLNLPKNYLDPVLTGIGMAGKTIKEDFILLHTIRELKEEFLKKQETDSSWDLFDAKEEDYQYINKLTSYSMEGIEKWSKIVTSDKSFVSSCFSLGDDSTIYLVYFNTVVNKLNLICLTKEGKVLYEKTINSIDSNPILDHDTTTILKNSNYLYFGFGGNIYFDSSSEWDYKEQEKYFSAKFLGNISKRRIFCFDTSGNCQWIMEQPNPIWKFSSYFNTPIELSNNGSILYVEDGSKTIYCLQDAKRIQNASDK